MEIYTLKDNGELDNIVEGIYSLIWTERYSAYGDFELLLKLTPKAIAQFQHNVRVISSLSDRVMVITSIEKKSSDGRRTMLIKGYSMEYLLLDKLARSSATSFPYRWRATRPPAVMARNVYREIMFEGVRSPRDILPDVGVNENPIPNAMPEPSEPELFEFDVIPVYEVVKQICDAFDLGFRITRNHNTGALTFRVYTGFNRTSHQLANPGILFNENLDNLTNANEVSSMVGHKNVAWVYSEQGRLEVLAEGVTIEPSGRNRKVLVVKAEALDEDATQQEIILHLRQKGREALNAHRIKTIFDGEVSETSQYKYGVDYGLGDLVEFQPVTAPSNESAIMRITEQIFALDTKGLRTYPTLVRHSCEGAD